MSAFDPKRTFDLRRNGSRWRWNAVQPLRTAQAARHPTNHQRKENKICSWSLDAHNLLNNGVRSAELHRLMRNLFGMVPVKTAPQSGCDGHNGNRSEKSFQTLHGLSLSFFVLSPTLHTSIKSGAGHPHCRRKTAIGGQLSRPVWH